MNEKGIDVNDLSFIAYSHGPGLAPCLLEGLEIAKKIALKNNLPLVPVNHSISHLEIFKLLTNVKDPVVLYVSGPNTQIISYSANKYRIFGETLDIGVGNLIDSFARHCGIGFPAGPKIEALALRNPGSLSPPTFIELPYTVKGMDVAFSGLFTNLKQKYDKAQDKEQALKDLAFSLQETAFAMLLEASERALAFLNKKELALTGGVACNKRLQEMARIMCQERKAKVFTLSNEFLGDNGLMIAYTGMLMAKNKKNLISLSRIKKANINPYERTDYVDVNWI